MNESGNFNEHDSLPVLPGYELIKAIGRGGKGVVYEAQRTYNGQEVAIKLIEGPTDSEEFRANLKREAQLTASLENHHILPIIDLVETASDTAVVMKRVHGRNLSQLMRSKDITQEERERYLIGIADATDYLQRNGLTHRDIKPKNILIANSDGDNQLREFRYPIVADFGISTKDNKINKDELFGTIEYMTPEQQILQDKPGDSEAYSVGQIAFEMYMGAHIADKEFSGDGNILQIYPELREYMGKIDGLSPDVRKKVTNKYGERAANVFDKIMKKDPNQRYQTATEFITDLVDATR